VWKKEKEKEKKKKKSPRFDAGNMPAGRDTLGGLARVDRVCFIALRRPGAACVSRFRKANGVVETLCGLLQFLCYCQGKIKCRC
jgi:hypothetical protein